MSTPTGGPPPPPALPTSGRTSGPPPPPALPTGGSTKNKHAIVDASSASLKGQLSNKQANLTNRDKSLLHGADYYANKHKSGLVGLYNQGATCYLNSLLQALFMTPEFCEQLFSWKYKAKTGNKQPIKQEHNDDPTKVQENENNDSTIDVATNANKVDTASNDNDSTSNNNKDNDSSSSNEEKEKELTEEEKEAKRVEENKNKYNIPLQLQRLFGNLLLSQKKCVSTKALTTSFHWDTADVFYQQDAQELLLKLLDALEKAFLHSENPSSIKQLFRGQVEEYVQCMDCNNRTSQYSIFLDLGLQIDMRYSQGETPKSINECIVNYLNPEVLSGTGWICDNCKQAATAIKGVSLKQLPKILILRINRFTLDFVTFRRIKLNDKVSFPYFLNMHSFVNSDDANASPNDVKFHYQLYAVMVHKGSANSGHYFAYIKSWANNNWYMFNDREITEVSEEVVESAFGFDKNEKQQQSNATAKEQQKADTAKKIGSVFANSTANAYMLLYRNCSPTDTVNRNYDIPANIVKEIEAENTTFVKEKAVVVEKRDTWYMHVKYNDTTELVTMHKKKTLGELKEKVVKQLNIKIPLEQTRLRIYNAILNKPTRTFSGKENVSLDELKFTPNQLLFLETRSATEQFTEHDENEYTTISLVTFTKFADSDDVDCDEVGTFTEPIQIAIKKTTSLAELKELVHSKTDFSVEKMQLALLDNVGLEAKLLTNENFEPLITGALLCAEIVEPNQKQTGVELKFEKAKNTIEIKYNLPNERLAKQEVTIDKRNCLFQLKQKISKAINVPLDEFKICNGMLAKTEFKNLSRTLKEAKLFDGSAVFVQLGIPLSEGQYLLKISQFVLNNIEDNSNNTSTTTEQTNNENSTNEVDRTTPTATPNANDNITIFKQQINTIQLVVSEQWTPNELTTHCKQHITINNATTDDVSILWREAKATKAGKFLHPDEPLKQSVNNFQDNTHLLYQIINNNDIDTYKEAHNMLAIQLQRWLPSQWTLEAERRELLIPRFYSIKQLQEHIVNTLVTKNTTNTTDSAVTTENDNINNYSHQIEIQNIKVAKAPKFLITDYLTVATLNWHMSVDNFLTKSPWYIKDGDVIFYKDNLEINKYDIDESLVNNDTEQYTSNERSIHIVTEYDDI